MVGIHVQGEGMLADLYRSVVNVFEPIGAKIEIDTTPCLPNGIPPDTRCYIQIGTVWTQIHSIGNILICKHVV